MRILQGQDFALGALNTTAATTHNFLQEQGLQPRTSRMLGRLSVTPSLQPLTIRGLLTRLSISGNQLLLNPTVNTQNVAAGSFQAGFPGRGLLSTAMVDRANVIAAACGPNTPLELSWLWSAANTFQAMIGTDLIDASLIREVEADLARGVLWGDPNFALGCGEVRQATANTVETMTLSYRAQRDMLLERLIVDVFRDDGAQPQPGDFTLTQISIAGTPLLSTAIGIDCLMLSSEASDEDGLQINERVGSNDVIEVSVAVAALGAGVSGIFQHGYFTS